jgi:outer membrane protein assembly factor BamE (lipoprotein component of BamABCDE complex)
MERPRQMVNASDDPTVLPGRRWARAGLATIALLGLGACSWMPSMPSLPGAEIIETPRQVRGHMVDEEELQQIVVGVSSRRDVEALLGSPTATGTFDDSDWFYIGGITRQRPGRQQAIEEQRVVKIRFDGSGTVQEVKRLGLEDAQDVRVVERVTPSPGNERTLMQQLFGNIGRVGPGLGSQPAAPGSPTPSGR